MIVLGLVRRMYFQKAQLHRTRVKFGRSGNACRHSLPTVILRQLACRENGIPALNRTGENVLPMLQANFAAFFSGRHVSSPVSTTPMANVIRSEVDDVVTANLTFEQNLFEQILKRHAGNRFAGLPLLQGSLLGSSSRKLQLTADLPDAPSFAGKI